MLNNRKIILNTPGEIDDLLNPYADDTFQDFSSHTIVPGAIYIITPLQFAKHKDLLNQLVANNVIHIIICNPSEGSEAMYYMYKHRGIDQLLLKENTQIPIISGGFLPPDTIHFYYERFLPLIHDYKENITVIEEYNNNKKSIRPYT